MQIHNETPFPAGTLIWEDASHAHQLTTVVKLTCAILTTGSSPVADLADSQLPLGTADEHYNDDPNAPVRIESDRVPFKPLADVVLVGSAHAPHQQPVTQLDVSLRIGDVTRTLRVFGDRAWNFPSRLALVPYFSEPKPFTSMELSGDRSFGGTDFGGYCAENPAGTGYISRKSADSIHGKRLPNIEDPANLIRSWDSRPRPVGIGFYGRGCQPRLAFAGTITPTDPPAPVPNPPPGFSPRFYNGAHPDLQFPDYLRGDELIVLTHLMPQPKVEFRLPGLRPKVDVREYAHPPEKWIAARAAAGQPATPADVPLKKRPLDLKLDTLVLLPDQRLLYLVFRGTHPLADPNAATIARVDVSI